MRRTYEDQPNRGDDGHDDTATSSQRKGIDLHEGLRSPEGEEGVKIGGAEEKEDRGREAQNARSDDAGYDAAPSDNTVEDRLAQSTERRKHRHTSRSSFLQRCDQKHQSQSWYLQ